MTFRALALAVAVFGLTACGGLEEEELDQGASALRPATPPPTWYCVYASTGLACGPVDSGCRVMTLVGNNNSPSCDPNPCQCPYGPFN